MHFKMFGTCQILVEYQKDQKGEKEATTQLSKLPTPFSHFQNNVFNLWKFCHKFKPLSTLQTRLHPEGHSESCGS